MTGMRIDQFAPRVSDGDAVSGQMINLQRMLHQLGYASDIFCEQLPIHFKGKVYPISAYNGNAKADNVLLLHYSLAYSPTVLHWLTENPSRKVLVYHNITPHRYFAGVNPVFFDAAQQGRVQLPQLRSLTVQGWGVSRFNAAELQANGWVDPPIMPIIFDPARSPQRADPRLHKQLATQPNILFVGRIAPNKHIEDIILIFHALKKHILPAARLYLVGSTQGMTPYLNYLQALVSQLNLSDVYFSGHVSQAQWLAYYQQADVFVSMSEHEGFGIPLLESMYFKVPIIAFNAGAVAETLGASGILITRKKHHAIAALIGTMYQDSALTQQVVTGQQARVQQFSPDQLTPHLLRLVQTIPI